ncbi:MAG: aconitate hydratase AcnA [Polyangiaceae bacterium]|jgi:aconitate hydratase|nr:aconitate hydratase AcnA [Polyangiaceae bacterium]MBK8938302.1 aconitate hydratase AcnA [Polyangiaceae bacterium]
MDSFSTRGSIDVKGKSYTLYRLSALAASHPQVARLPWSMKVLLENLLRKEDGRVVRKEHIEAVLSWDPKATPEKEISFYPARVLMQDFTGVPAVADLAAMREALAKMGGKASRINPLEQSDLVIDHSVQVDHFATPLAPKLNTDLEYERNTERYVFLRWGAGAFNNFGVVPPSTGICHQVNLEYLAKVVYEKDGVLYPDTLVGTDSHTVMVNGLGVVGWGVGGIEAEAAMLGQPCTMLVPQVVGFKMTGRPKEGITATDIVLVATQMLRKKGVVGKFVEFFGPGVKELSLEARATVANMAPEYGATIGFFAVDEAALAYLRFTGRSEEHVARVEAYSKAQGLWFDPAVEPSYSDVLELDLSTVEPSLAGPKRPQDRVPLTQMKGAYEAALKPMLEASPKNTGKVAVTSDGKSFDVANGAVVIAAITSCTNTSNPAVLVGAGLVAKRAVERGLTVKPWVKTSLAPGSQVVTDYLTKAGLIPFLDKLGFNVVGYGCTTCIGNSGPLPPPVDEAIEKGDLVVASVLSGNRNFEGRVHPRVRMNFLASPPLVVAYALKGDVTSDLSKEPIGQDSAGKDVFLKDLWPTDAEIHETIQKAISPEQYKARYAAVAAGDEAWRALEVPSGETFKWDDKSTYVRRPPFFDDIPKEPSAPTDITGARCLALLGDSITTDHISPAGNIAKDSPAAKYLTDHGVERKDFNSYGARRGNHEVMMRGTFANIRLKNLMLGGVEGGRAKHIPSGEELSIYDASMKYQAEGTPLVILAGAEYGTGSSRDWAAKGTKLLGVKAVIAKSFERIHRSNLVGMGVLPLEFEQGQDATTLGLTGFETFSVTGVADKLAPKKLLTVTAKKDDGSTLSFRAIARIDTPNELDYFVHGGILVYMLRQLAKG